MLAVTISATGFVTKTPFAPLPLVVLAAASVWYVRCLRRLPLTERWPQGRTWAFFVGVAIAAFSLLSGMAGYDGDDFLIHGTIDAAVAMVAPFGFALGAPFTLARAGGGRRARALADALLDGRPGRALFHPLVVWVVWTVSLFGLYFLPVYRHTYRHVILLDLGHLELALAGCLVVWSIAGADRGGRLSPGLRIAWLLFGLPYYSVFGMAALSVNRAPAPGLSPGDVHGGGDIIWSAGEVIAVAGTVAVVFWWLLHDLHRAKDEDVIDAEALDLQASMWRVSRILAKTEAEKAAERAAAIAAGTVPTRSRGVVAASEGATGPPPPRELSS